MNAFKDKMFFIIGVILVSNSIQSFGQTMNDEQLMGHIQRKSCFIQTSRRGTTPSSISGGSNNVITFDSGRHMDGYSSVSSNTNRILLLIHAAVNYTFNQVCLRYTSYHASIPADFCQNLQGESSRVFGGVRNTTQETLEKQMMNTLSCLQRAKTLTMNDRTLAHNVETRFSTLISPRIRSYQLHLPRAVTGECQLPEDSSSAPVEATVRDGLTLLVSVSHEMGRLMSLAAW